MHAITVLAIGMNLSIALKKAWESRSLFLTLSPSPGEASSLLNSGDFDLCLIGTTVSRESRAKFMSLMRHTLHSKTPIISVADDSDTEILNSLKECKASQLDMRRIGEFLDEIKQPGGIAGLISRTHAIELSTIELLQRRSNTSFILSSLPAHTDSQIRASGNGAPPGLLLPDIFN